MKIKNLSALALAVSMGLLAGCSGDEPENKAQVDTSSNVPETTTPAAQPATMPEKTVQTAPAAVAEKTAEVVEQAQAVVETATISGGKVYETCVGCHGASGEGGVGPKLSGQAPDVLVASLTDYKAGKEKGPLSSMMIPMATPLSTEEIKAVSEYIAGL